MDRRDDVVAYTKAYQAEKYEQMDPRTKLLYPARKRAKQRGMECTITQEDIVLNKVCPLLGIEIHYGKQGLHKNSPSLDRIDNAKGYVPGNVWVISHRANTMKNSATQPELEVFAKNILGIFCHKNV